MQVLTYKYRLLPTRKQHEALIAVLDSQRVLYNAALDERIDCYRKTGHGLSYIDQSKALTQCRRDIPEMATLPVNIQRGTLKRLDGAYKAFFRRAKARNGKVGFPRFRGKGWFNSFDFNEFVGIRFDGKRLRWSGMPSGLRVHLHRRMPDGKILASKFKRDHKGWSVCLAIRVEMPEKRIISSAVGIDVGIKTLAATSDGLLIPNPRAARRAERELRVRQRALARCKRGSNRRPKVRAQVARLHAKVANTRSTSLHQISAMLVNRYDAIVVEALNVKGLSRGILARDVHDASWSKLVDLISYKAARAGKYLIKVDPKYTSQICPECGSVKAKTLAERTHDCACGYVADRDVAAARVILSRAGMGPGFVNVAGCSERRTGKLTEVTK
jgi:putative transposase